MSRRRHPFLYKGAAIGKVRRRRDGERPAGEPAFRLEEQEGVLWKKAREDRRAPPEDKTPSEE